MTFQWFSSSLELLAVPVFRMVNYIRTGLACLVDCDLCHMVQGLASEVVNWLCGTCCVKYYGTSGWKFLKDKYNRCEGWRKDWYAAVFLLLVAKVKGVGEVAHVNTKWRGRGDGEEPWRTAEPAVRGDKVAILVSEKLQWELKELNLEAEF